MGQKCKIWPLKVRHMNKFGPKWPVGWQLFLQEEIKYETSGSDVNIPYNKYYIWAIAHHLGTYCICINSICKHAKTLTWFFVYIHFVNVRAAKALTRLCACSGASEHWLKEYAVYVRPFCACVRAVKALARLHTCSSCAFENRLLEYTICTPILCMCESSEGSGETACMLRLVWALTDKICHEHTHFVYVRAQWRLWQDYMHTNSRPSIDWKICHM